MQNNDIRKTIPEPLMFIHTVSTPIVTNGSRRYFDSRDKRKEHSSNVTRIVPPLPLKEIRKKTIDELLFNKIKNIVQMYRMDNPISCLIETENNESIEGIPFAIENEQLLIKREVINNDCDENEVFKILLIDIKDVIILKV